jgi:thioredoxin 1
MYDIYLSNNLKEMRTILISLMMLFVVSQSSFAQSDKTDSSEKKAKVTFIEFGSVRCIPCQKMEVVLESIRKEFPEDVKVVFHDVWTETGKPYAEKYKVESIPTQIFLDADGKEYFRHVGFFPKEDVIKILKKKGVKK